MLPLPSAVNEPTRAKKSAVTASCPTMENAYWPLRVALEKLPVGGGGTGMEPPPPQAAAKTAANRARARQRRLTKLFKGLFMVLLNVLLKGRLIGLLASGRLARRQEALGSNERRRERAANHERSERREPEYLFEPGAREKRSFGQRY